MIAVRSSQRVGVLTLTFLLAWRSEPRALATEKTSERRQAPKPTAKVEPRTKLELVFLTGGSFHAGCEPGDTVCSDDEKPGRDATVGALWVGRTEVPVEAYARCVRSGHCSEAHRGNACTWGVPGLERHPINCVTWDQAEAFCEWMGGRLPTADEWEHAAKGGESRIFPWGNEPVNGHRANFGEHQFARKYPLGAAGQTDDDGWIETAPVGSYPDGATPQGLLDMVGNVAEWTSSDFTPEEKEIRGGGWGTELRSFRLRSSYRTGIRRTEWQVAVGMRCVVPSRARVSAHGRPAAWPRSGHRTATVPGNKPKARDSEK